MELLIVFFLVSIVFSFLCSIWEAVLLSIPPSYVAVREKEGGRTGRLLRRFKADVDRPLAAILTLNTIAHTVGAIGVGAQAAKLFSQTRVAGVNVAAVLVPTVMTLAILILSEIIPKTLGAGHWRALAGFTVSALNLIVYLLYPLVWLSQKITRLLKPENGNSVLNRSEFTAMAQVVAEQGVLEKQEYRVIQNLMRLRSLSCRDVMTPRTVVAAAGQELTVGEYFEQNPRLHFTRIPVFGETIDDVKGFVMRDDILSGIISGRRGDRLKALVRPIVTIGEAVPLPAAFNLLLERHTHIAVVVDRFGGTAGILTLEDIVETLLGLEIVDEFDRTVDMQALARENWTRRAREHGLLREDPPPAPQGR